MPTSDEKNFGLYKYTADNGDTFTMRVEVTIAESGDFGFTALDSADPMWVESKSNRARTVTLCHLASGRTRETRCGTTACDAFTDPDYTITLPVRGLAALQTFQVIRTTPERRKVYRPQRSTLDEITVA